MDAHLIISAIKGFPEVFPGDDLSKLIGDALSSVPGGPHAGDIIAVTSKIVSKAEGQFVSAVDREEAIAQETVRVVATKEHAGGVTRIVENRQGLVLAAAGVDNSNAPKGTVLLLPTDPDLSAARIGLALTDRFKLPIGVIVTDTLGRPWREGQTDAAIGAWGIKVIEDYRGNVDQYGNVLTASFAAVADEIASAADLVKGKTAGCPVALVRGLDRFVYSPSNETQPWSTGRSLIRDSKDDLFRLGSAESYDAGYSAGWEAAKREFQKIHLERPVMSSR